MKSQKKLSKSSDPERPVRSPTPLMVSCALVTGSLCATILLAVQSGCGTVDPAQAVAMSVTAEYNPATIQTSQWSGWRGDVAGGVGSGLTPAHWGPSDVQWQVEVPGRGNSSPVVWGEHILLTTEENNELSLLSYDRQGALQWRQAFAASPQPTHQRNGHATATVATNGDVIVAKLGNSLHALTFDGVKRWSVTLPEESHKWGAASSPVICGNAVIQLSDSGVASELGSYALADGSLFWKAPIDSDGSWSTPLIVRDEFSRPTSVVINGTGSTNGEPGRVLSFDVLTGQPQWEVSGTSDIPCPTALFAGDRVISATGTNGPILAIHHETGELLWSLPAGGAQVPTGIIMNQMVFLISDHGEVTCRSIEDGELFWKHNLPGKFSASLVATPTNIYATNERGRVFTFAASGSSYQAVGESDLAETCLATPAIVDDQLLFRTVDRLVCVGERHAIVTNSLAPTDTLVASETSEIPGEATIAGEPSGITEAPAEFLGAGATR